MKKEEEEEWGLNKTRFDPEFKKILFEKVRNIRGANKEDDIQKYMDKFNLSGLSCGIRTEPIQEWVRLDCCCHHFCKRCIIMWMGSRTKPNCPTCRAYIRVVYYVKTKNRVSNLQPTNKECGICGHKEPRETMQVCSECLQKQHVGCNKWDLQDVCQDCQLHPFPNPPSPAEVAQAYFDNLVSITE